MRFKAAASIMAMTVAGLSGFAHAQSTGSAEAPSPTGSSSQEPATESPPEGDEQSDQFADIVVTAQRRTERLQDVPIAVTALTSAALTNIGVTGTADLQLLAPGLQTPQASGSLQATIRGIGTTTNGAGFENPVAVYIDGVYIASSTGSMLSLNGIERVEVLKGPQGTLFGRNATGGLIQVITRDPSPIPAVETRLTYANYKSVVADSYLTGGLADGLSADLAIRYETQGEGWGTNLATGRDVRKLDHDFAARGKLLFQPADETRIRLALDYSSSRGTRFDNRPDPRYASYVSLNNAAFGGPYQLAGPYGVNEDLVTDIDLENYGTSLQIEQGLGAVSVKSITAYRSSQIVTALDLDELPVDIQSLAFRGKQRQFSQELQLAGDADSALKWILGGYFFYMKDGYEPVGVTLNGLLSPFSPASFGTRNDLVQFTHAFAGYAQATYEVLNDTNLTGGIRYSSEKKRVEGVQRILAGGVVIDERPAYPGNKKLSFDNLSFRVSVDHKITRDVMVYLSYNTGFKSGGFSVATASGNSYAPEKIKAIEAGIKSEILDRKLRMNLSGFYYDYSNLQNAQYVFGQLVVNNGPKARIYGLDGEVTARIARGFTLNGGVSLLNARYQNFPDAAYFNPGRCTPAAPGQSCNASAKGNALPYAPDYSFNVGANYRTQIAGGTVDLNVLYNRTGKFYAAPANFLSSRPYDLLNASIRWTDPNDHLSVQIWGKNITRTVYPTQLIESAQAMLRVDGDPQTYGVTLGFKF